MSAKITVSELRNAADQCVKCAVCLPHCPTYALSPEEAESPRGRITLLQGIVYGRLEPTAVVHKHLNNCLNCGRCEQVCPAQVPYTRLLDGTRAFMQDHPHLDAAPGPVLRRLSAWLLASPRTLSLVASLTRLAKRLVPDPAPAKHPARGSITRWLDWVPSSSTPPVSPSSALPTEETDTPQVTPTNSDAWLFAGCLTDAFEKNIAISARKLAVAHGIQLLPTPAGLCCGALYQHLGNSHQTHQLAARNIHAVAQNNKPVVVLPSGCSRGLIDGLGFSEHPAARETQSRITDIFSLLDKAAVNVTFSPGQDNVGIYMPCSTNKNAMGSLVRVLNRVLSESATLLGTGHGCCGAAGDHMLAEPEKADRLAAPIVDEITSLGLTHVLTPNVGCAWHLRANLAQRGVNVTVEHPVLWLERHMIQSPP